MRVLVSGAGGLIGRAVATSLERRGVEIGRLVRHQPSGSGQVWWDPKTRGFDEAAASGAEAIVHLAGENVGSGRWTAGRKAEIRASRVEGTRRLAEGVARLESKPGVLVIASAVGFYGSHRAGELTEASAQGSGFLSEVCRAWEDAADPARAAGVRVVHLRFGLVLSRSGGALAQMLPLFRLCLGGRLGSGDQWMSWVTIDDVVRIVELAIDDERLHGPWNVVAPHPVTNAEFTQTLAGVLHRPALLPVPAFVLRLALGEMADELLLSGARVVPAALLDLGFRFAYPELTGALDHLLRS